MTENRIHRHEKRVLSVAFIVIGLTACSTLFNRQNSDGTDEPTAQASPSPSPSIEIPSYTKLPQPQGYDLLDVETLFYLEGSPDRKTLVGCDEAVQKLLESTTSVGEINRGVKEIVTRYPDENHWCFYSKVVEIEEILKSEKFIDEKQKDTLHNYRYLVPVARAYMEEYQDSRYLRWAVRQYRKVSENLFHRALQLSPDMTDKLVETEDPFYGWKENLEFPSVMEKYKLKVKEISEKKSQIKLGEPSIKIERTPAAGKPKSKTARKPSSDQKAKPIPSPKPSPTPSNELEYFEEL